MKNKKVIIGMMIMAYGMRMDVFEYGRIVCSINSYDILA